MGQHILVVDDDTDIQQLLHDRLKAGGYQTFSAFDGVKRWRFFNHGTSME